MNSLTINTPRIFVPLLEPARYKGIFGGRGSGKSHFFAEALVEKCIMESGTRFVCIREIQKSLEQSVKRTIEDKIEALGVGSRFRILDKQIETPGGGLIIFMGMQTHTADSIKSLEGYAGAWIEEAQSLSAHSLRLLRPTIRRPGSELWFSWNPESPEDPVDQLLRGDARIPDAIVVKANWQDNPWFPDVLEQERRIDLNRNQDEYSHVWDGEYVSVADAIIFRNRVTVDVFETPKNARFFHGADWGFSQDPTVLIRCFVENDVLFVDEEVFGYGVELDDTPALFDSIPTSRKWPLKCDSARPETISYIRRHGFPMIGPAEKWSGSVEDGIACLKSFKRIIVHERCRHTAKEFRLYSFKVDRVSGDILPIIVDKHNHCIAPGQLVDTLRGPIPIENVLVGDSVRTRDGWRPVSSSGKTSDDREWWELQAGGKSLVATRDHKVFTTQRGFVSIDALRYTDEVLVSIGGQCAKVQDRSLGKPLNMADILGIDIQRRSVFQTGLTFVAQLGMAIQFICTGQCGKRTSASFRKAIISTIKTITQPITRWAIWNVSRRSSMPKDTLSQSCYISGGRRTLSASVHSLWHGIVVKMGGSFIPRMAMPCGMPSFRMTLFANAVGRHSKSASQRGICSVPMHVNRQPDVPLELITKNDLAPSANRHSVSIDIPKSYFAPARVQCVRDTGMRGPVYDLSINGIPEFVANGILVHNSIDSLRYALDGYIKGRAPIRISQQLLQRV